MEERKGGGGGIRRGRGRNREVDDYDIRKSIVLMPSDNIACPGCCCFFL